MCLDLRNAIDFQATGHIHMGLFPTIIIHHSNAEYPTEKGFRKGFKLVIQPITELQLHHISQMKLAGIVRRISTDILIAAQQLHSLTQLVYSQPPIQQSVDLIILFIYKSHKIRL
jgi:hypothetical protein